MSPVNPTNSPSGRPAPASADRLPVPQNPSPALLPSHEQLPVRPQSSDHSLAVVVERHGGHVHDQRSAGGPRRQDWSLVGSDLGPGDADGAGVIALGQDHVVLLRYSGNWAEAAVAAE